ncbi:hypothetical protein MVEN_00604900 [Mycena venus]|uniref:Uncharacterized protein n=1 Tax=Mycena venus TaxID=2733690 RepID=A0A8H6YPR0_9AGAR|nr:hypothetical protein MVEN_00604900 [Mycena venus]
MDDFWYDMSMLWESISIFVGTFFYGIYLVLFCICIYILRNRPRPGNTVLLVTAIALFTLSTVQAVINLVLGAAEIDYLDIPQHNINRAGGIIYGVNNIIADGLVIYRCFVIWDRNIRIVILPMLMLVVTSVFGVDIKLPENPYFALSLATNVLVTALTAGRIWWVCRQSRLCRKFRTEDQKRCVSAISILVESGLLYSAAVLAYLVLGAIPRVRIVQEPIYEMLTQVMGIAPTLIIVRVGLGVKAPNVEGTLMVKTADVISDNDVEKGPSDYEAQKPWSSF